VESKKHLSRNKVNQKPDLTFKDKLEEISTFGKGEWVTVFSKKEKDDEHIYCALIPIQDAEKSLKNPSWDLSIGHGFPGFVYHFENGKRISSYYRFSDKGVEPLVFWRSFHGIKDGYWEILEEFRNYFNFYEDKNNNKHLFIDENGDEHEVIIIEKDNIKIKLKYLKEFLAVKKMYLAIFFDFNRFSNKSLAEQGLKEYHRHIVKEYYCYSIGARNWEHHFDKEKSHGWLMGKKLIQGLKDFEPQIINKKDEEYEEFIIGFDDDGNEILFTCNEDKLSNYFGKNEGAPQYVTPVFFRKDVLTKYYSQPNKYSVHDGYLECSGLWGLRIDNNHPDHVVAFLGDLGHLGHNEQLYWKHYNIGKKGKISYTAWARNFKAEFADPERSDLFFKQRFKAFNKKWREKFGWNLFSPLSKNDEYHFKTLRIPLTNEQNEFDEQVLSLTKLLIDSLNEKKLTIGLESKKGSKGIDKLEDFLRSKGVIFESMIEFLRDLQYLRSSGVAHLKGKKYKKIKKSFGIDEKDFQQVFSDILIKAIWTLNSLENYFLKV